MWHNEGLKCVFVFLSSKVRTLWSLPLLELLYFELSGSKNHVIMQCHHKCSEVKWCNVSHHPVTFEVIIAGVFSRSLCPIPAGCVLQGSVTQLTVSVCSFYTPSTQLHNPSCIAAKPATTAKWCLRSWNKSMWTNTHILCILLSWYLTAVHHS